MLIRLRLRGSPDKKLRKNILTSKYPFLKGVFVVGYVQAKFRLGTFHKEVIWVKKTTKKATAKAIQQYKVVEKQIAKYNEKHNPLYATPKKYRLSSKSIIPFGHQEQCTIGISEGMDGNGAVFGGSGSGKSSCFAIPTLRGWRGALVCTDVKGEMSTWYKLLRRLKYVERPELIFDPEDEQCPRYDTFALIDQFPDDKQAIISLLAMTLVPVSSDTLEPHFWDDSTRNFLKAAFVFFYNQKTGFFEAIKIMRTMPIPQLIQLITSTDEEAGAYLSQSIDKNPYLLSSIESGVHNALEMFSDPHIARTFDSATATEKGTLTWDKINKYNIFLKLPIEKIKHWKTAFAILYSQLIFSLNKRKDKYSGGEKNIQTLLLMDEFASFGRIPHFEEDISTLRSKSVNIFIILQSLAQLDGLYGVEGRKVIMDNCSYKLIFKCNDVDTRRYFAELIGTRNVLKFSLSASPARGSKVDSISFAKEQVNIVEPQELGTLDDNDVFAILDGHPYRLKEISMSEELYRQHKKYSEPKVVFSAQIVQGGI